MASLIAAPMAAVWPAPPLIADGVVVAAPPRADPGPEATNRRWTFADGRPALRFEWPAARPSDPPWALTLRPTRVRDDDGAGPGRSRIGLKLTLSKRF
jgi:hypothetical protein